MNYKFENIPAELKNTPQWIVWRAEDREGKPTKVPYQVNGEMAQSNNKRTWSTFHTAVKSYSEKDFHGIGFMFSKDDPFVGIDIDHCVADEKLNDFSNEILNLVDSYAEFSPSGKGIHIITKGSLPLRGIGTGKKNPSLGLEVYRHGRYFTFTGNKVNDIEVNERSDQLKELFKKYLKEKEVSKKKAQSSFKRNLNLTNNELWEKMFNSKKGQVIKSLFLGELVNGDHSSTDIALCNHLAFWTDKDASKMDSMFRETNLYREKWERQHSSDGRTYGQMTIDNAIQSTHNKISDSFDNQKYEIQINQGEEQVKKKRPNFKRTDLGNAERLVYQYGKDIRYNNSFNSWYLWDGKRWEADLTNQIKQFAKKTVRSIYEEASQEEEDDVRQKISKHATASESRPRIESMISLAQSEVPILPDDLDKDKWLFNCANGVVDLRTGKLLQHDRKFYMNKISPVSYDPDAKCPLWMRFLEDIMQDDAGNVKHDLIDFLQKAIGYALTGDTSEQVLFVLYGKGKNGKSTFLDTIRYLVGDYGTQANTDSFTVKKNDSVRSDLAALKGSRLVAAAESEEGAKLAESLIKQLTGGDAIQARFLYGNPFVFTPQFKIFFMTNYRPVIGGSDEGIWRRIRLIPFTVTVPDEKVDKYLPDKLLKQEMPGILNWALEGCLKWKKEGLGYPKEIKDATEGYRNEMDTVGTFLNEYCTVGERAKCYVKDLYRRYEDWCDETGEHLLTKVKLNRKVEERGFKKKKDGSGHYFQGIGIKSDFSYSNYFSSTSRKKI
ncbi:phage/plasmid primase, P4 family [Metabacillus idriensis]|uniref:phage/plasmid primase, P4 family n=1 Tax=Metabacillus idriensis TaxID=324768 RepID=UPI00174C1466|nr:phage/plasmid primase, P4 family [Metabacillus idriensis]